MLPLIDWSLVRADWSLSYVFGKLRGLVFSQMKMNVRFDSLLCLSVSHCLALQLWKMALSKTTGSRMRGQTGLNLDNHKANRARDMADGALARCDHAAC